MSRANRPVTAISYFGGKMPHLKFLYDNFVEGVHLVDCMCGSACVAINADRKKYKLITINDLNRDVINLFNVLRNDFPRFLQQLLFTPFSREEFYKASEPTDDPIEWARRFYVRCSQGYSGQGSQNIDKHSWGYECATTHKYNGKTRNHYRVTSWNSKMEYLQEIVEKLRNMQIENRPFEEMFDIYGRENTLLYLDPPYPMITRSDKKRYRHEFSDPLHQVLCARAVAATCHVAISSYENEMYNDTLIGFKRVYAKPKMTNTSKKLTQEVLYINYEPLVKKLYLFT